MPSVSVFECFPTVPSVSLLTGVGFFRESGMTLTWQYGAMRGVRLTSLHLLYSLVLLG